MYVTEYKHCLALQEDIDNLRQWADDWKLKLNVSKCSVVSYGRTISFNYDYSLSGTSLQRVDTIKDLRVIFDSKLKFNKHVDIKVNVAYQNLEIIRRTFIHLTPDCCILLYKCLVRSHIEYANSVWNTQYIQNHKKIEKVQMRATKLIHELKGLPYRQRLERLIQPPLKYRRIRGDD